MDSLLYNKLNILHLLYNQMTSTQSYSQWIVAQKQQQQQRVISCQNIWQLSYMENFCHRIDSKCYHH